MTEVKLSCKQLAAFDYLEQYSDKWHNIRSGFSDSTLRSLVKHGLAERSIHGEYRVIPRVMRQCQIERKIRKPRRLETSMRIPPELYVVLEAAARQAHYLQELSDGLKWRGAKAEVQRIRRAINALANNPSQRLRLIALTRSGK